MNNYRLLVLICFLATFCAGVVSAAPPQPAPSPAETARVLAEHLGSLDSLSFNFSQRTSGQMSGRARQASGTAYLAKSGATALMRWNYHSPEKQVIISDGEVLKMYFASLNQMLITPADSLQRDVTYALFSGGDALLDDFIIEAAADQTAPSEAGQFRAITLVPRSPESQIREITLWILDGRRIKRIEIHDAFDTLTLLTISNIEENSLTLADGTLKDTELFHFTPPEGTEIIHQ